MDVNIDARSQALETGANRSFDLENSTVLLRRKFIQTQFGKVYKYFPTFFYFLKQKVSKQKKSINNFHNKILVVISQALGVGRPI